MRKLLGACLLGVMFAASVAAPDANPRTVMNGYVQYVVPDPSPNGSADPPGWILAPEAQQTTRGIARLTYLEQAADLGGFKQWDGLSVEVSGEFLWDSRTPQERKSGERQTEVLRVDRLVAAPPDGIFRAQILADLEARGIDILNSSFGNDREPAGALTEDGRCGDGLQAGRVVLEWPPIGGADMYTTIAYLCADSGQYWAHRSGGIGGWSTWVGPFPWDGPFPGTGARLEGPPERVTPSAIPIRKRARNHRITIHRKWTYPAGGRVSRRDYTPADFDLGPGITVIKVLRASKRRIRVRVSVSTDAQPGTHDVGVHGQVGEGLLTLRPRR